MLRPIVARYANFGAFPNSLLKADRTGLALAGQVSASSRIGLVELGVSCDECEDEGLRRGSSSCNPDGLYSCTISCSRIK